MAQPEYLIEHFQLAENWREKNPRIETSYVFGQYLTLVCEHSSSDVMLKVKI